MRRKDREITDKPRIMEVIRRCDVLRLGFAREKGAYILPLSFGIEEEEGELTFYFHGASQGRKVDLIRRQGYAGFEMDTDHLIYGEEGQGCTFSSRFKSVIGGGEVSIIDSEEEKIHALNAIMEHYRPGEKFEYNPRKVKAVTTFKLKVKELSCKVHE